MKLRNFIKVIFLLLFLLILSSCAKVFISDSEWCSDLGEHGASCANTLSDNERDIPKEQWDIERVGQLCTKSENFAEWKASLLKLCEESNRCKFEEIEKINKAFDRLGVE